MYWVIIMHSYSKQLWLCIQSLCHVSVIIPKSDLYACSDTHTPTLSVVTLCLDCVQPSAFPFEKTMSQLPREACMQGRGRTWIDRSTIYSHRPVTADCSQSGHHISTSNVYARDFSRYPLLLVMICSHSNDIVEPENWLALLSDAIPYSLAKVAPMVSGVLYMLTKKDGDEGIIPIYMA